MCIRDRSSQVAAEQLEHGGIRQTRISTKWPPILRRLVGRDLSTRAALAAVLDRQQVEPDGTGYGQMQSSR
eukprot:2824332-Amphidinium_carterae.1